MAQVAHKMTLEEFAAYAATHGRCELIDGEVHTISPAGGRHGLITMRLAGFLFSFVQPRKLGTVLAAETGFVMNPAGPTVRAPDVAYFRAENANEADTPKFIRGTPDLVVEVLSPDDRASEVNRKTDQWLRFGVRLVWIVDPETRTVTVRSAERSAQILREDETLTGDPVVPGFQLAIRELFV